MNLIQAFYTILRSFQLGYFQLISTISLLLISTISLLLISLEEFSVVLWLTC